MEQEIKFYLIVSAILSVWLLSLLFPKYFRKISPKQLNMFIAEALELDPLSITSIRELSFKEKLKYGVSAGPLMRVDYSGLAYLLKGGQNSYFRKVEILDEGENELVKFIEIEVKKGEVLKFDVFDAYTY